MSAGYKDFGFNAPGPSNDNVGLELAEIFVSLVRRLDGVDHICDLGCGNGYLASSPGASGFRVTGIDASESGLEIANRHYATAKINFVRAEIGADPMKVLPDGLKFDAVVSSDVIEHLYRPAALIEAAAAMLKPGGRLVVGTPYHGYLKNLALSVLNKWDFHHGVEWDGGHTKFCSVRTLSAMVRERGFEVIRFRYFGRAPYLWKNMICLARKPRS